MKILKVPLFELPDYSISVEEVSNLLDGVEKEFIASVPWPDYSYKPDVAFTMGYTANALLIKFYVHERYLQAVYRNINDPVHKDSCVEFFIAFDQDDNYYNLEFNSIGACLAGYGQNRDERKMLPISLIKHIRHQTRVRGKNDDDKINWELTLIIPREVFCYNDLSSFGEQDCRVNFYKCGDDLPEPHFLTWNAVKAEQPDFHLPQYFGKMQFIWS